MALNEAQIIIIIIIIILGFFLCLIVVIDIEKISLVLIWCFLIASNGWHHLFMFILKIKQYQILR